MLNFASNNGVYLIAEIGGNHEGNFEYAKELTVLAAESGADAVKYQIYTGDSLVNSLYDPERNKHFKRFQLTKDQYIELANLCGQLNVSFMASVWDIDSIDYVNEFSSVFKIGSGDMTAYNLIKKIVKTGKPIILSTGLADFNEVENAVNFIEKLDADYISENKLALLQCTSMYPIPDEDTNLNVMLKYKRSFNLPVGYSDHTIGADAIEIAVSMGAEIVEVHFTDSRAGKEFRDHVVSLTCDELKAFLRKVQKIKTVQGTDEKRPMKSEIDNKHLRSFRRAVYPIKDLPAGHIIRESDLVTLRPMEGIGAEHFFSLVGLKIEFGIKKYQKFDIGILGSESS